jgi:hypothetical protein
MIKFSIEVRNGTARFRVAVQAETIERALALARRMYPGREAVGVKFPTIPEGSLVGTGQQLAA